MLTCNIDIAVLSVCLSHFDIVSKPFNIASYFFSTYGSTIILVFLVLNIFVKFGWGFPVHGC